MPKKRNAFLAQIEAKYRAEYEAKYLIAEANFLRKLDMALQQSSDSALMAADDVFGTTPESAKEFHATHVKYMNEISRMAVDEDKDDPEMVWTKATIDRRLLDIVGKDNFVPYDERYGERAENA